MAHSEPHSAEEWAFLDDWLEALTEHLGIDALDVPIAELLDATRVIAHDVARPAAPLSTFVLGVAVARSGGTPQAVREVAARATELAQEWRATRGT